MNARMQTLRPVFARLAAALLLATLLLALAPGSALAEGVVFVGDVLRDPPPATLGPYTMTPLPPDTRETGAAVTAIAAPTGEIALSAPHTIHRIPVTWSSWAHGYTGPLYFAGPGVSEATLTLPPDTLAFYLYIKGNNLDTAEVYAIVNGVTYTLRGGGFNEATYFGFYSLDEPITSVTYGGATTHGVCVGEFGIYTGPAPVEAPVTSPRADVAAVIYGGWSGIPVQAWVGGTAQPTLYTAPNHEGHAAVLFTFWPPEGAAWKVGVSPALAAGLDASRWEIKLVGMTTGGKWVASPTVGDVTITQGSQIVLYYQLVDKG